MVDSGDRRADLDRAAALIRSLEQARTQAPEPARLAPWAFARLVDIGVAAVAALLVGMLNMAIIVALWGMPDLADWEPGPGEYAVWGAGSTLWITFVALHEVVGPGARGWSAGKGAMGLRLLGPDGTSVPARRRLGRWLTAALLVGVPAVTSLVVMPELSPLVASAWFVSLVALLYVILRGSDGRGVHDLLWGTAVVAPRPQRS